jgi:hypothetical protein
MRILVYGSRITGCGAGKCGVDEVLLLASIVDRTDMCSEIID